jgi:glyoxylase-like metal-dependent hydrolase (beta-lactamase superfamily II)
MRVVNASYSLHRKSGKKTFETAICVRFIPCRPLGESSGTSRHLTIDNDTIKTKIQLLGHATFKVTTPENKIIIVDPWLIDNPYIPLGLENQNVIDLILVTHGHEDHFDIHIQDVSKRQILKS